MANKTTLVVTAVPNPKEMAAVQEYLQGVMPLFVKAGGEVIRRLKVGKVINGRPTGMVLVMDFDTEQAVVDLFESDEYKALVPVRDRGFAEMNIRTAQEL